MPEAAKEILLVEDDFALSYVMSCILKSHGFIVRIASTGKEALELIAESKPSALLLDVSLPDTDAFEIVKYLRTDSRYSSMPLIVHTSLELTLEEKSRLVLGHTEVMTKTFVCSEELPDHLTRLIAQSQEHVWPNSSSSSSSEI